MTTTEKTLADLKARIEKTIGYIESLPASAFEGAETRQIAFPMHEGMSLQADGLRFLKDWCLPNLYFHAVTAYDILRQQRRGDRQAGLPGPLAGPDPQGGVRPFPQSHTPALASPGGWARGFF